MIIKSKKAEAAKKNPLSIYPMSVCVELVRRAVKFAAVNDIRYYLNAVYVQPSKSGGVLVIASNGHVGIVLHDPNGWADKPYILPFNGKKNTAGLRAKEARYVAVSAENVPMATDFHGNPVFICTEKPIEAKYPDIAKIIFSLGEYTEGLVGAFNPDYIRLAALSSHEKKYTNCVKFFSKLGSASPVIFTTHKGFGLIMPMRDDSTLRSKITKDFGGTA